MTTREGAKIGKALLVPSELSPSTPRRGPLKRLFGDEPNNATMSMIASYATSTANLPISRERARTRLSSKHIPSFLSNFEGTDSSWFKMP